MTYAAKIQAAEAVPTEHERRANEQAAAIAAREVRAYVARTGCERHQRSLEAWQRGLRDWPWPTPTPEETRAQEAAMARLSIAMLEGMGARVPQVLREKGER